MDRTLAARLEVLGRPDLLILDKLGYLSMDTRRANLFFQLVSRRYGRGSIILTSNKPFEECTILDAGPTCTPPEKGG